jgi:hypothetical protein
MSIHMIEPRCLTTRSIGTKSWFQALFVRRENGFVGTVSCFVAAGPVKPLHGFEIGRRTKGQGAGMAIPAGFEAATHGVEIRFNLN